jgi:hypothetical protein
MCRLLVSFFEDQQDTPVLVYRFSETDLTCIPFLESK